ncbi:NUDIX hydrolase [Halosimplex sp. TS25]|uniref:NUDIX hydrolase n=1 Tax=Halosimplex rarum TaxID=3396619 RepID=UPI0039EB666E
MPSAHVNRETVERRMERLRDDYGPVSVEEVHEEVPPERFERLREGSRRGYIGGAYAWVVREPNQAADLTESMPDSVDDGRRVLMILGRGSTRWGLAGGGREDGEVDRRETSEKASGGSREHGETYEEAAVREVREETGVDCEITDCFLFRRFRTDSAGDHDERLHALYVFFDADYAGGHIAVQPGELNGAAWFAQAPARLHPANEFRADDFWADYEADDPLGDFEW